MSDTATTITAAIDKHSVIPGEVIAFDLSSNLCAAYRQLQVEIFDVGVENPISKLGMSSPLAQPPTPSARCEINTHSLNPGFYEIALIRFHEPAEENTPATTDKQASRDYKRLIFEVRPVIRLARSREHVVATVLRHEKELEARFLKPVDIRKDKKAPSDEYAAFVFVEGVLISTRVRLGRWEILPTGGGLDAEDKLNFVNRFLTTQTPLAVTFSYEETLRQEACSSMPVSVVHFPVLIANDAPQAREYCARQVEYMLLALSLTRGAAGQMFDLVVFNRTTNEATKFFTTNPYRGNLLTGAIAGEHPEVLAKYVDRLSESELIQFHVRLFAEALREQNVEFQYVRYWQILEMLAEARNYDPKQVLRDHDGNEMYDDTGERRLVGGSVHTVFALFRDNKLMTTDLAWKHVNIWFAFRSAVGHCGALDQYSKLSRQSTRSWAELGANEIAEKGNDPYLAELKANVDLLLKRELSDWCPA